MEMHMVHEDPSKARAVVSVLYSTKAAGDPSKTLTNVRTYVRASSCNAERCLSV